MAVYRNPTSEITRSPTTQFRIDVLKGLTALPKFLQSKYFYDADGDKLFRQIMNCPEYYLTDCELEIFSQQTVDLGNTFLNNYHDFDIIELGPGDASKSTCLLKYLVKLGFDFTYFPIDISKSVTDYLEKELPERILGLEIKVLNGEYIEMIKLANKLSAKQKIVLFLGGNIGNFSPNDVVSFLFTLRENLSPGDLMLIGFDLKKNPKQILAAYNDKAGVTRQFNLNLLKRINRQLGANFVIEQFDHYPTYNPITGACRSYLVSQQEQLVCVAEKTIHFAKYEAVYTELSQKYSVSQINALAAEIGFKTIDYFIDSQAWFLEAVWEKV